MTSTPLRRFAACLALACAAGGLALPTLAQHGAGGGHAPASHGGGEFHGGHWHGGGPGWWGWGLGLGLGWDAGVLGYPYPGYYYPYPPEYVYPEAPPVVVAPQGPSTPANWYYCESAKEYYPRVSQCPEPWRLVPAVPPGPTQ
jgi:hypothetical protein